MSEIETLINREYSEVCKYLKEKYGLPKGDFFCAKKFTSKNQRIKRSNEGLFIHHVYENKMIMLSNVDYAKNEPFEYQEKENLVYCNYLEHLLLHIKIMEEHFSGRSSKGEFFILGVGGVENFMIPEINDIYSYKVENLPWRKEVAKVIIDKKQDYFLILKKFVSIYADWARFIINDFKDYCKNNNKKFSVKNLFNMYISKDEKTIFVDLTQNIDISGWIKFHYDELQQGQYKDSEETKIFLKNHDKLIREIKEQIPEIAEPIQIQ